MTDAQFLWYIISQYLVAIGTTAAVVAALFGNVLRTKVFPPILKVKLRTPAGELTKLTNASTGAYVDDTRYYHVQVFNERRWSPATNAGLRLVRLEERGPDGQFQVMWLGDIPVGCRDQAFYPLTHTIGRTMDFDLCGVRKSTRQLEIHPIVRPNNLRSVRTGECHLILFVQVNSTEVDSDIARFQIDWDGLWHEGDLEMQKHLQVKMLPPAPKK